VPSNPTKRKVKRKLCFRTLGLSERRLKILERIGYERPTPVQAGLIPLVMDGLDLIGQARTGTGKTAAFGIPIIELLEQQKLAEDPGRKPSRHPKAIVLVPTRELCLQVTQEIQRLSGVEVEEPGEVGDPDSNGQPGGRRKSSRRQSTSDSKDVPEVKSVAIYGGKSIRWQINRLREGADIVVGTPGRVIDHLTRATLQVDRIQFVVLDEADRMLDIGFRPDIERIFRRLPEERQSLLLSATLPPPIQEIAKRFMHQPKLINFSPSSVAADTIDQYYFTVREDCKDDLLIQLLDREQPRQAIIFCRTRLGTQRLYRKLLKSENYRQAKAIHGDMTQPNRDKVMASFRSGKTRILVATDVVGRGIDVSHVSHIINYDIPELSDDYVHRVGRTGRMGREGVAYSLVTPLQRSSLQQIEKRINKELILDNMEGFDTTDVKERKPSPRGRKKRYRRGL
jgi:ATP-dependent RNA helicase DeaD